MKKENLNLIKCPYCGSRFKTSSQIQANKKILLFGSVCCACDEFPVVSGILILNKRKSKKILTLIKENKSNSAVILSLFTSFFVFRVLHFLPFDFPFNLENLITFFFKSKLLLKFAALKNNLFSYYLQRKSDENALLYFLPLAFIKRAGKLLWLDVGSGLSPFNTLLEKLNPNVVFIATETNFRLLFLSKNSYLHKQTFFINMDVSVGPLLAKKANIITLIDTFPYVEQQKRMIDILTKSLNKQGILLIGSMVQHVYLPLKYNVYPLRANTIKKLFPSDITLLDENKILDTLLHSDFYNLKSDLPKSSKELFRYTLLWPKVDPNFKMSNRVPVTLRKRALNRWSSGKILWENKVY